MDYDDDPAAQVRRAIANVVIATQELIDAVLALDAKRGGRLQRAWKRIMAFVRRAGEKLERLAAGLERFAQLATTAAAILAVFLARPMTA